MSLLDRIAHSEDPPISNHAFYSAIVMFAYGRITEAQLKTEFGIVSASDLTEWNFLKNSYAAAANKSDWLQALHSALMLAETHTLGLHVKANIQGALTAAQSVLV